MTGDPVFDKMFAEGLEKQGATPAEYALTALRGTKRSLFGSHGLGGWLPLVKHPVKSLARGIGKTPLWMLPFSAMGLHSAATTPGAGPMERVGRVAGSVLPIGMMGLGHKGPGMLGATAAQEALGGGMFVREGLLPKAGRKIDELLFKKKQQPQQQLQAPPRVTPPQQGAFGIPQDMREWGEQASQILPDLRRRI